MAAEPIRACRIFYSYAHEDENLRNELHKHLSVLEQQQLISGWYDRDVSAGTEWQHQIDTHLNTAHVILLLISPNFMASHYCSSIEMRRAMERHEAGEARVIPIILREVDWEKTPFAKLEVLPSRGKVVATGRNRDRVLAEVAKGIRKVIEELASQDEKPGVLEQLYRQQLDEKYRTIDFKGIMHVDMSRPLGIPLREVFVFPDVQVGMPEYETLERDEEDRYAESKSKGPRERREDEQETVAGRDRRLGKGRRIVLQREELQPVIAKNRRLVILGDPGGGKSTLLKYVMLQLVRDKDAFAADFPQLADVSFAVPLYIRLTSYGEAWPSLPAGERSLKDYLPRYLRDDSLHSYIDFISQQLADGNVFVLLDGLDEIPNVSSRIQIVRQIEAFTQTYPKNRFIVTSRIIGYKEAPLAAEYQLHTLADFSDQQIARFTQKWCLAYERWVKRIPESSSVQESAAKEAEQLFQAILHNPGVKKLAVNPLLLTILALIQRQGIRLPSHRIKLYQLCTTTLMDHWIEAKGISPYFNQNQVIKLLCPLAFWMHEYRAVGGVPEQELTDQIVKKLIERKIARDEYEAVDKAEKFLDMIRSQTGILVERGHQRYGFLHQTFEEYFAAKELVNRKDKDRDHFIREHLHEARWREVILLAVGIIGVIENKEERVTELVQDAILKANSPFEEWLHHDLLFAGRCLADDVGVSIECEDEIVEQIVYLYLTSPYNSLREAFSNILSTWNGTRVATKVLDFTLPLLDKEAITTPGTPEKLLISLGVSPLQRKLASHCRYLIQEYQEARIRLLRLQVITVLYHLQIDVMAHIEFVLLSLSDSDSDVRRAAATALGQLGSSREEVVEALLKALSDSDWSVRRAAVTALGQLGGSREEVVEALLKALSDADSDVRQAAVTALGQLGGSREEVVEALLKKLSDSDVQQAAVTALGQLGDSREEVVEALLKKLSDADSDVRQATVRQAAAIALGQLGGSREEVVETLLKALSDSDWSVRRAAVAALGQLGGSREEVVETLLKKLSDSEWWVRQAAVTALGQLGGSREEVVEALLKVLSDADSVVQHAAVRRAAATALGQLGGSREEVVEALLKALSDADSDVQQAAATALGQLGTNYFHINEYLLDVLMNTSVKNIARRTLAECEDNVHKHLTLKLLELLRYLGSGREEVVEVLLKKLSSSNRWVRQAAVTSLGQLGGSREDVVEALLKTLADADSNVRQATVRQAAATALGQLGGSREEVVEALLKALFDSEWWVRQAAVTALGQLGGSREEVVETLLKKLSDANSDVRQAAATALGQLGGSREEVVEALLKALFDSNWSVRQAAATALGQLGGSREEVVETLLKKLSDADSDVRQAAATALGQLGGSREEVVEALLKKLSDADSDVRQAAATALGQLGDSREEVVEALLKSLSDPNWWVRQATATALGQLGGSREEVVEALLKALSDADSDVRRVAATALGQLGGSREEVVEALLKALSDADSDVRRAATDALTILQIDRQAVGQQIKGYLLSQEPIVSKQYEADNATDALLFALQQIIGEA